MANTIIQKTSGTQSSVPGTGDLELGELAVNTYDGKLYLKKDSGTPEVVEVGGSGGSGYLSLTGTYLYPTTTTQTFRAGTGGTTTYPTYAGYGDINTGINLPGNDVVQLVTGSGVRLTASNTGVAITTLDVTTLNIDRIKPNGGTTGLPEFSIPADPNTGMHLATGDVVELVTGAQARLTISGNDISIGMDTLDYVGFFGSTPVAKQAELTDELTDNITVITHTAPTTPDYAIQDLTDTGGFGFATKDEGNTVLAQIKELQNQVKNLRTRNIELEDKLVAYGLLPDAD
jgi:hypothetical protein